MAFICILCGGLQVLLLLSITGILMSVAALSRLMELIFTITSPIVVFMLRKSLQLILLWIVISLQQISSVFRTMCSIRPFDIGDLASPTNRIIIGTTPVRVAYAISNYEGELGRKTSLSPREELKDVLDNLENEERPDIVGDNQSRKSTTKSSPNNTVVSGLSRMSSEGPIANIESLGYINCMSSRNARSFAVADGDGGIIGSDDTESSMEIMLSDLGDKIPWLCSVLRPEYTPYFNTAGTVLLGWMVVCWVSHIVWTLLAPLVISTIAVVIVCPSTAKWLIKQMGPNVENALRNFVSKVQASMPDVR